MSVDRRRTMKTFSSVSLNVLIVEDEPLVSFDIAATIHDLGHCAVEAATAGVALRMLAQRDDFDLVMADFGLPDRTGSELATEIIKRWPAVAVVLVTGYPELPRGLASELPRLTKPVTTAQIASLLDQLTPMARVRRDQASA